MENLDARPVSTIHTRAPLLLQWCLIGFRTTRSTGLCGSPSDKALSTTLSAPTSAILIPAGHRSPVSASIASIRQKMRGLMVSAPAKVTSNSIIGSRELSASRGPAMEPSLHCGESCLNIQKSWLGSAFGIRRRKRCMELSMEPQRQLTPEPKLVGTSCTLSR